MLPFLQSPARFRSSGYSFRPGLERLEARNVPATLSAVPGQTAVNPSPTASVGSEDPTSTGQPSGVTPGTGNSGTTSSDAALAGALLPVRAVDDTLRGLAETQAANDRLAALIVNQLASITQRNAQLQLDAAALQNVQNADVQLRQAANLRLVGGSEEPDRMNWLPALMRRITGASEEQEEPATPEERETSAPEDAQPNVDRATQEEAVPPEVTSAEGSNVLLVMR